MTSKQGRSFRVFLGKQFVVRLKMLITIFINGTGLVLGCSFTEKTILPSNFCLVEKAEVIVLAKAVRQEFRMVVPDPEGSARGENLYEPSLCVVFTPVQTLKGEPPYDLCLAGFMTPSTGIQSSWSEPRGGALAGSCFAYDYAIGHFYLLFLQRHASGWTVLSDGPLARVNEEVSNADDPWVAGIRRYLGISSLPSYAEKRQALSEILHTEKKDSELYKDAENFLRIPWPSTPGEELLRFLGPEVDSATRRRALFLAAGKPLAATHQAVDELLDSPAAGQLLGPLAEYADRHELHSYWNRLARIGQETPVEVERLFVKSLAKNLAFVDPSLAVAVVAKCKPPRCRLPWMEDALPRMLKARVMDRYPEFERESLLLAKLDDPGVIVWAQHVLSEKETPSLPLAIRVLASSSKAEDRTFMQEVFCNHRKHISTILTAFSEVDSWPRLKPLADLIVTPELSQAERAGILTLLRHWTRFEPEDGSKSVAKTLLESVEQGKPPESFFFPEQKPMACEAR